MARKAGLKGFDLETIVGFVAQSVREGFALHFGLSPDGTFKVVVQKGADRIDHEFRLSPQATALLRGIGRLEIGGPKQ